MSEWQAGVPPKKGDYLIAVLHFFVDEEGFVCETSAEKKEVLPCYMMFTATYNEKGYFTYREREGKIISWENVLWSPIKKPEKEKWKEIIPLWKKALSK